jgi:hypothetical protein
MARPENDDPFRIWNDPFHKDDPFAPHNGFDGDNPFKPWNSPFGKEEDLTARECRDYGLRDKRRYEEDEY